MNRKRVRDENAHDYLQLACGSWFTNMDAVVENYASHQTKCMLCKNIAFETTANMRYDVSLKCGADFMRSLSRKQYATHQRNCEVCESLEFERRAFRS